MFRASITINVFVLVYLALYSSSENFPSQSSSEASPLFNTPNHSVTSEISNVVAQKVIQSEYSPLQRPNDDKRSVNSGVDNWGEVSNTNTIDSVEQNDNAVGFISSESGGPVPIKSPDPEKERSEQSNGALKGIELGTSARQHLFQCDDLTPRSYYALRGPYWVLYNYIKSERVFRCDESVTYTTHGDYTFLDNLIPLLERWQGPLSLAMYAPNEDFHETLIRIRYLRECSSKSKLIRDFVTFHIFFDGNNYPKGGVPRDPLKPVINCSEMEEPTFGEDLVTMKKKKKLTYPVNVARNVARDMSTTHFVLASDIELYPNPNLIPDFLNMVRVNDSKMQSPNPKVYVLSIFEVESYASLPGNKNELVAMLKNKTAIPFHKYVCTGCHKIPKAEEWVRTRMSDKLEVFTVGKRNSPFQHWEPIYIGTKFDPIYDERLSWEGRSDKMTQVCGKKILHANIMFFVC